MHCLRTQARKQLLYLWSNHKMFQWEDRFQMNEFKGKSPRLESWFSWRCYNDPEDFESSLEG